MEKYQIGYMKKNREQVKFFSVDIEMNGDTPQVWFKIGVQKFMLHINYDTEKKYGQAVWYAEQLTKALDSLVSGMSTETDKH